MLKTKYLFKSIVKHRTSSALTILSLVISFTGIIILSLYVSFEKSFDHFHKNADSIYRVETRSDGSWLPAKISGIIQKSIPEVKAATPIWNIDDYLTTPKLEQQNAKFLSSVYFADSSFFKIFSFPLIMGDKTTVLNDPHAAVISQALSEKLFGNQNPMGKTIIYDKINFTVKGVMANFPKNSSLQADCVMAFSVYTQEKQLSYFDHWSEWSFQNILLLETGSNSQTVAAKIAALPDIARQIKSEKDQYKGKESFLYLRPINKIHFFYDGMLKSYTNPLVLNILILLIIILGVMGAVNFINFSTSQAPLRAKSLSVMRVLGGKKSDSRKQLLAESVILSLIALTISLVIYEISYRSIESLFQIEGLSMHERILFMPIFVLFAIVFGIIAGFYPSRYITSPPVAQTVKGNIYFSGKGKAFRNTLVIVQFVFSIVLISASFIIEKQLNYWRNFDIGINKNHVVYLNMTGELKKHYQAFADELMKNKDITDYTYTQFIPGNVKMRWGREVDGKYIQFNCWPVDGRFLNFFGIKMVNGRKFTPDSKTDLNTFILNQKAVEQFGWKKPLEKKVTESGNKGQVIGVAKDFNFSSLESTIPAMAFWRTDQRKDELLLRLLPGNYTHTIDYIKNVAHQFDARNQFDIKFLNAALNKLYSKEERMSQFIDFVAIWTIWLAITGLLGLVIFISRDHTKEIGIRKVNGAKISEVMIMLNKDFIKWVAIAFVIATPIAWFAMNKWLENFAYKTSLSWWIFALSGILAMGIALLTVSWQSWKAATRNPVEALRYE